MRVRLSVLVLIACVAGVPTTSFAEKARAREDAKVYNRMGERGKVVLKVKEGQVMRIDRKEGRWYKVRVSGRTGWIPRTKVELLDREELVRNTRRRPFVDGRSTKRGFGGEEGPADRVGADAVGDAASSEGGEDDDTEAADDEDAKPRPRPRPRGGDPDDDEDGDDGDPESDEPAGSGEDEEGAEVVDDRPRVRVKSKVTIFSEADEDSEEADWTTKPDAVLFVMGKRGKFTEVENDDGDIGFILSSKLEPIEPEDGSAVGGPRTRVIDARARAGVTIIQQGLRTVGGVPERPDNYNLSTSAVTIALGGAYLKPYSKQLMFGGEVNLDVAKAVPGIKVDAMNTTGITLYHLNARGLVGYDLKRKSGMMVFGRLGLRYQSFQVSDVGDLTKNTARLPSEIVTAPTIGAALAMPRLTDKIGLRFSVDAMLVGASLEQTKDLEDGKQRAVKGATVGAGFTYRWKKEMDIQATYDLNYARYNFGEPLETSMRGHTGTNVSRTDIFHGVTVGIAKAF